MNRTSKIVFKEWAFITLGWILILYFYILIIVWGYRHIMEDNVITEYFDSGLIHFELLIQGILIGSLFALIDKITDKRQFRRRSLGSLIIFKSSLYLLSFAIAGIATYAVYQIFGLLTQKQWQESLSYLTTSYSISIAVYFLVAIIFMNFLIQVSKKFGPGELIKILLGKYHTPKNEKHIFMFMDLQGSTAIAEKLGHNKYSQLMQNCFYDLTDVVIKYDASIYQYVGDEVVLNWDIKRGLQSLNCINAYFAFEKKLKQREEFYISNFDTIPFFKCGLDAGEVTVAEIGDIKREIAYHGDVLNTAARIEKQCTPLKKKMIISENLKKELPDNLNGFEEELIGEIELKGRKGKINLYGIEYNNL
jgi:adenylate cyclase